MTILDSHSTFIESMQLVGTIFQVVGPFCRINLTACLTRPMAVVSLEYLRTIARASAQTRWSTKEEPKLPTPLATKPIDHPVSFETDKDPSKTTHCTVPHPSASRLVQYALMIDAGSTGSRIHIYKFNNCFFQPMTTKSLNRSTQTCLRMLAIP
ncbi:hypothetical protein C8J56DRAFT_909619 [Mycena floridula]|nr:hypothetical protein C8J56DRAFT_909619 [Mycena floridula]